MIDNINELAAEAHKNAVEHGFYDVNDAQECNVAMLHCELSEAIQADREGSPLYERLEYIPFPAEGEKIAYPEGTAVELADFVIRLMDYAAGRNIKIPTRQQMVPVYSSLPRLVNRLHSSIIEITHFREISDGFGLDHTGSTAEAVIIANAVELVETFLDEKGVDLWQVVREKMAYNKTRPVLHGKKY